MLLRTNKFVKYQEESKLLGTAIPAPPPSKSQKNRANALTQTNAKTQANAITQAKRWNPKRESINGGTMQEVKSRNWRGLAPKTSCLANISRPQ